MGIDIRVHIVTIIALLIFFGIGVMVGIAITRQPAAEQLYLRMEKRLDAYRKDVAKELNQRNERIRQLEKDLSYIQQRMQVSESLLKSILPTLVNQSLVHRNISIVTCTPDWDNTVLENLKSILQAAGANIPWVLSFQPEVVSAADETTLSRLAPQLGLLLTDTDIGVVREAIFKRIALLLRYGDTQGQLSSLAKLNWCKLSGNFVVPVGSVVFIEAFRVGREEGQAQLVDIPLLRAMKSVNIRAVVCETTWITENSLIPLYQAEAVSTVDHLNTPAGLLSVVGALKDQPDHYGFKPSARRPSPDLTKF